MARHLLGEPDEIRVLYEPAIKRGSAKGYTIGTCLGGWQSVRASTSGRRSPFGSTSTSTTESSGRTAGASTDPQPARHASDHRRSTRLKVAGSW